jgi:ubiquinone/menaquinone biosynthesis C-methylase UbiE
MIHRAREDHPHLDLHVGDATMLSFDDHAFDAVVAASVINVVADAETVLSEMHRVCAPGGTVSVLVPSTGFTDEDLDVLIDTLELTGFSRAALTKWHRGPTKTSKSHLEDLFQSADLGPVVTRRYLDGMLIAASAQV